MAAEKAKAKKVAPSPEEREPEAAPAPQAKAEKVAPAAIAQGLEPSVAEQVASGADIVQGIGEIPSGYEPMILLTSMSGYGVNLLPREIVYVKSGKCAILIERSIARSAEAKAKECFAFLASFGMAIAETSALSPWLALAIASGVKVLPVANGGTR